MTLLVLVGSATAAAGPQRDWSGAAAAPKPPPIAQPARPSASARGDSQTALVHEYCATCHSDRTRAGGLSLAAFDAVRVADMAAVGEKMIRKLRAGMMPPPGARRPDAAALAGLAGFLETTIETAAAAAPRPGWRPFQRL